MGFNPFKSVGNIVKGVTRPFKKILRSPIGKAAGLAALYQFGPMMGGHGTGAAGWQKMFPKLLATKAPVIGGYPGETQPAGIGKILNWMGKNKALTAGAGVMAAGALGDDVLEESKTVIDDRGHKDYLNAREMYLDEWAKWLMDQDDTLSYEEAMEKVSDPLFEKAQGGIVGLAQGGRIGMQSGNPNEDRAAEEKAKAVSHAAHSAMQGQRAHGPGGRFEVANTKTSPVNISSTGDGVQIIPKQKPKITPDNRVGPNWFNQGVQGMQHFFDTSKLGMWNNQMQRKNYLAHLEKTNPEKYTQVMEDLGNLHYTNTELITGGPEEKGFGYEKTTIGDDLWEPQAKAILGTDYTDYLNRFQTTPGSGGEGGGGQAEWQRLGYSSYEDWLAAQGGGGGAGTGETTGDYYGFDEWEQWAGAPTTPLFGDTTKYKALLNRGGRIGLYAGGMGVMNSPMNPMMNQGLGAMGSQGMNPYNQQNLMQQAQMRGQPQGRPPMPGGPTTAQGPGLASLPPAKNEDTELLKLIRMLASMGIPMEQLRGRTKEELVEMVMSLSAKAEAQGGGGGGEEVVEEQEEVVEAAHGGRIHAAGGLGEIRTGYAMGTEQPIIPSKDGPQIDYRGIGGYQPHGAKEKKDDVRALLAQGEFVVTSDAVKGIGGGDRDLGAKRMYDIMHKYEPIGRALG